MTLRAPMPSWSRSTSERPSAQRGDGQADIVGVDGGAGGETIVASLVAGAVSIKGLPTQVSIAHVEAVDTVFINGFGGNDSISVAALPTKAGQLVLDGGHRQRQTYR